MSKPKISKVDREHAKRLAAELKRAEDKQKRLQKLAAAKS